MTGVRVIMVIGCSRGNDDINNVRLRLPNTQQPAISRGWVGGNKDNKEEEYNGCWRMIGKAALATAKRRGGAMMTMMRRALRLVEEEPHQRCNKDGARQYMPSRAEGCVAATWMTD